MPDKLSLTLETFKHRLDEIPDKMKSHIRMGFHLLARCTREQRSAFLEYILNITEKGENLDRENAIALTGLDNQSMPDVLSAIATTIGFTVDSDISEDDFILHGKGLAFNLEDEIVVKEIVQNIVLRRKNLNARMEDSALGNSVLPSFQAISIEVDLRIRFDDSSDKATGGVPIAVCILTTDCTDDVWFQMSNSDVDDTIKKLQLISKKLKIAESIINGIK